MQLKINCFAILLLVQISLGHTDHHDTDHHNTLHDRCISALKKKIFKGYVRDVKPDGQVTVKAGFSINDIELDPTRKVLKTTGWAESTWTDSRLAWKPEEHGGIDRLNVHHHHIWLPDMTLYNMVGPMTHLVETNAIIMSSGLILNFPYISVETHCDVNYQNWPWGMQNCTYTSGSWTYAKEDLDFQPYLGPTESRTSPLEFERLDKNQFEILSSRTVRTEQTYACCPNLTYPQIETAFQFRIKQIFKDGKLLTSNEI